MSSYKCDKTSVKFEKYRRFVTNRQECRWSEFQHGKSIWSWTCAGTCQRCGNYSLARFEEARDPSRVPAAAGTARDAYTVRAWYLHAPRERSNRKSERGGSMCAGISRDSRSAFCTPFSRTIVISIKFDTATIALYVGAIRESPLHLVSFLFEITITTQAPFEVWMAIANKASPPKDDILCGLFICQARL